MDNLPALLEKAGITQRALAPLYLPDDYSDYSEPQSFMSAAVGDTIIILVKLETNPAFYYRKKPARMSVNASDGQHRFEVSCFGNTPDWKGYRRGDQLLVKGKVAEWNNVRKLDSASVIPAGVAGQLIPKYRGDTSGEVAAVIAEQLEHIEPCVEWIRAHFQGLSDGDIMDAGDLRHFDLGDFVRSLHRPRCRRDGEDARHGALHLEVAALIARVERISRKEVLPRSMVDIPGSLIAELVAMLPFEMSEDQCRAVQLIVDALRKPTPADVLLSGDVGTGKTAVIGTIAVAARRLGKKVAILVPNVLLVRQIAGEIEASWGAKVKVARILPGVKPLPDPADAILVGTSALFSRYGNVDFDVLVVDEQHKLSFEMRERLRGAHTNFIEGSATCIPETAGLVLYGSKAVAKLEQCPVKKVIRTELGDLSQRMVFFSRIREVIAAGGQAAVIYPKIAGAGREALEQAVDGWKKAFPGRVGVLHGKMKDAEKDAVIAGMHAGDFDLLVSTTVIEVGVTLPALKALMVIEPDRYGVSQLHQMRGRVARKGGEGLFLMYLGKSFADYEAGTLERLQMVASETSGFRLAEYDMNARGFGVLGDGDGNGVHLGQVFGNLKLMPPDVERALKHLAVMRARREQSQRRAA